MPASGSDRLRSTTGSSRFTGDGLNKKFAHESFHLAVKHVVAADEPQVFKQLPRKERDDGAVIRRAGAVELDGVMHLGVEHRLENDLAGFLRRERFERQKLVAERRRVERVEIFELAVEPARELGQRNVERVEILRLVLRVHFDDQAIHAV